MQLAGFIEALSKAGRVEELFALVCDVVAPLGYDKVGLFAMTREASEAVARACGDAFPIVISNYPETFTSTYLSEKRHKIDPAFPLALSTITPLVWDEIVGGKKLSDEQRALIGERRQAGIHNEVTCPIHGANGRIFALRFARGRTGPCDRAHLSAFQVLAIHFYYAFVKFLEADAGSSASSQGLADNSQKQSPIGCPLSQREQEVLLWTARGKSASSISVILELSENTVNFYVKNAMRKLGTTNRVVAVVLAVRSGLIQP